MGKIGTCEARSRETDVNATKRTDFETPCPRPLLPPTSPALRDGGSGTTSNGRRDGSSATLMARRGVTSRPQRPAGGTIAGSQPTRRVYVRYRTAPSQRPVSEAVGRYLQCAELAYPEVMPRVAALV
jgi:hypothetical protein